MGELATESATSPPASPLVSVVVPLYNKGKYVLRALNSILSQTRSDLEVIVVDDGSTDNGPDLVRHLSDPRIRSIWQPNGGPGLARNRGIAAAATPFVAFLDADDEWLPGYLEAALDVFERLGTTIVAVSFDYTLPDNTRNAAKWQRWGFVHGIQHVDEHFGAQRVTALLEFMSPCTTVVRTSEVRRWGGFYDRDRCRYAEDTFLWLRLIFNGDVITDGRPLARVFTDAADLSSYGRRVRPIEPFLEWPELLAETCPARLKQLLSTVLKLRALKTSCVLGYWGDWRSARHVLSHHCTAADVGLPLFAQAALLSTPIGSAAASLVRFARASLDRARPTKDRRTSTERL